MVISTHSGAARMLLLAWILALGLGCATAPTVPYGYDYFAAPAAKTDANATATVASTFATLPIREHRNQATNERNVTRLRDMIRSTSKLNRTARPLPYCPPLAKELV